MTSRPGSRIFGPRGARRPASVHTRLRVLLIVVVMVLSVFGARLFQLQGVDPKAYAAKARADGAQTVTLPATRGAIEDRTGRPLADSVDGRMLIADPASTKRYATTIARILADRLDADYFSCLEALRTPGSRYQVLDRRVPSTLATQVVARIQAAVKEQITDPRLKSAPYVGVYTAADPLRSYPAHDVAANLLGFLDTDGKAQGGLEQSFGTRLAGTDGTETFEVGDGNRIPLGDNSETKPRNGKDLRLTIDRDTQWYVQRVLRTAVQSSGAASGSAVVMRTGTGEVLALADYPTYDANDPGSSPAGDTGSRALSSIYEPGSVEKVLTFGSLLDAHKVSPTTRITVPPTLPVLDATIHDYFQHDTLRLTATGVIAKSSNIGTVLSASQMSSSDLRGYLSRFGLGSTTNIGLNQRSGSLPALDSWTDLSRATIAFGQGISVNTLQMATAINAVANGGVLVTPSLVKGSATTDAGSVVGTDHTTTRRVISKQAATKMAQMMQSVPNPETGTAPKAQVPGYVVSGKTGTAQRVGSKCGCYDGTLPPRSPGSCPPTSPPSPSTWWCRTRRTVAVVARSAGRRSPGSSPSCCSATACPRPAPSPRNLPIEW